MEEKAREERIWDKLYAFLENPYGAAGVMGNLYVESHLLPNNVQNSHERKLGMGDEKYTRAVDEGRYLNFERDRAGYGLAQWTFPVRKKNLLAFARARGVSVGDLEMQLDFLCEELKSFPGVLNVLRSASTVREASDSFMLRFEMPANTSEAYRAKREAYAEQYFDQYAAERGGKGEIPMGYDPKKVIAVAQGEVGYLEKETKAELDGKTANAGDQNYTKYARDLDGIGFYNGRKQGVAWCDVFVDWCFVQAYGLEAALALTFQPLGKNNTGAGVKYSRLFYKNKGRLFDTPEPGDQIFFYQKDNIGGDAMAHTGLVYKVDKNYVYTVEGNTSGTGGVIANGGGVFQKKYRRDHERIAGYGRPNWGIEREERTDTTPSTQQTAHMGELGSDAPIYRNVHVMASAVNLREGDAKKYGSIGRVSKGSVYPWVATSAETGWYAIRLAKRIAWISPEYSEVREG